jgi:anti-sigma B factor antagonist
METVPTPLLLEFDGGDGDRPLRAIVSGEIDFASAPAMQARITAARAQRQAGSLILDLTAVEFMDSSGLRVILHLQRELTGAGGRLVLFGPTAEVRNTFTLTGLDRHLTVADTLEQAEALLGQAVDEHAEEQVGWAQGERPANGERPAGERPAGERPATGMHPEEQP